MPRTGDYKSYFEAKLASKLVSLVRIGGGRNSQVYRLECRDGRHIAAKIYHHSQADPRDRLGTEFMALSFLWQNGIRSIPKPLKADPKQGIAFYEYIEGQPVASSQVDAGDIDFAIDFLIDLDKLKTRDQADGLPPASEAFFSIMGVIANIRQRFTRLAAVSQDGVLADELHRFLDREFQPFFSHLQDWCRAKLRKAGLSLGQELPKALRTLSPSDFGFHNAMRRPDGSLIFLDFEYFGWDDPAKMIVDFLFHPAMNLPDEFKDRFVNGLLTYFDHGDFLPIRLAAVYPLFGLKWCLILLNEFVPDDFARRNFSAATPEDLVPRLSRQLTKSKKMFRELEQNYARGLPFN